MRILFYRFLFVLFILSILLVSPQSGLSEQVSREHIVAVVNGQNIYYKDIKADPKIIQLGYAHSKKLEPSELKKAIRKAEINALVARIQGIIKSEKMVQAGLRVSEKEIDHEIERRFRQAGIDDQKAKQIAETYGVLANALEEWQHSPEKADSIYEKKLASNFVTREQWRAFQACYDTPEKLAEMRRLIPSTVADMKENSRASCKRDLLFEKLRETITPGISVGDQEVITYYEQKYAHLAKKPPLNDIKDELRQQLLLEKRQEKERQWWQEQYKQAKIEIKDKRFRDALYLLIPSEKDKVRLVQKIFAILIGVVIFMGGLIFFIITKGRKRKATPI